MTSIPAEQSAPRMSSNPGLDTQDEKLSLPRHGVLTPVPASGCPDSLPAGSQATPIDRPLTTASKGQTFRLTVNHAMDEIINMRHMARELQSTLHTQLAVAQLCAGTDIPNADSQTREPMSPETDKTRGESSATVLTCGGGLELPLHIIPRANPSALETYHPAAAATRYSQTLERGIYQPAMNLWTRMLAGTPDAYDFNSMAADAKGLSVRDVVVQGLKWKYLMPTREGEELGAVEACRMMTGSVMPRFGLGKTIVCEYPRPVTQPALIRYIASQPFSRMIIVNLSPAIEENLPKSARPPYYHIITQSPADIGDVLHDNTVSPPDRQEWADIHADWRRYSDNHEANDAVRGAALNKARRQIRTVACDEESDDEGDQGARRAESVVLKECNATVLEGYIGQMPVLHLQVTDDAGVKDWKADKVAAMRLILKYLVPGYEGSATFGANDIPSKATGVMLISQGKHDRADALYVALRYLDGIIHTRDPLDISDLQPSLPSAGLDYLPDWRWHTACPDPSSIPDNISPTAPRKPIVIPAWIRALTPHLVPMMRLIDQTAEFRNYTTTEKDRRWLYDIVEIVMMYGLDGLVQADKWEEQRKSMYAKGEVRNANGEAFKRWRSVRKEDVADEKDKETVRRAAAAIKTLEREAGGI